MVRQIITTREPVFSPKIISLKEIHSLPFPFENKNVLFFGYGRVALYEGLRVLGVKEGDNVLVPNYICNVVVAPMHRLDIKVKFYEIDSNLKPVWELVAKKIDKSTKALIIVNYFGFPNDLDNARQFCSEHGLYLIEDNAQGFLSSDDSKPLGSFGDISIFSFRKILPIPNGAALVINNSLLKGKQKKAGYLLNKSKIFIFMAKSFLSTLNAGFGRFHNNSLRKVDFELDRIKNILQEYNVEDYFTKFSKLSSFLMKHFNYNHIINERIANYNKWLEFFSNNNFDGIKIVFPALRDGTVPLNLPVLVDKREQFISQMFSKGIECFPWPYLPRHSNDEYLASHMVCIPLTQSPDMKRIEQFFLQDFDMNNKINVALVYTSMNNHLGGKNIHLKNLYTYLGKDNLRLFIIGCSNIEDKWRQFMLQEGVKEEDFIMIPRFKKWFMFPFILQLRDIFIAREIDIVHTFQIQSDILGGLAARLAGIKNIISQYESKIIEDNVSMIKQLFYRMINKLIKKWFKKTIVVSEGLKKELLLEKFRAPDTVEVVHLGLQLPDKYKKMQFSFNDLKEGMPLIGTVGRLSKEKAMERLIMAVPIVLNAVPQAKFLIFGRGEEKENLLNLINRLGVSSRVILNDAPWIESIYELLKSIDIFVMPSVREGCPTALLEALALARPVIASDIEGVRDIVENEKNGFLIETHNAELFAEKIIYLCKHPEKAVDFGNCGREKILNNFTIESEMDKITKIYLDTLN
ncbi:MAG: glycosyltransferase [Candidatus Omnitrophota bacterium]|nr:glycosyltransferase [Candidatus Omnitrophota bacterium]